jgi:hypothetical protein
MGHGWGFYHHKSQTPDVSNVEDKENESTDAEKDIKPLTVEEQKQFKQQFHRFILSRKHRGSRAFRKQLFRRL